MNRFSAVTRCLRPASTRSHSFFGMIRGMMSKGQARSMVPSFSVYTVKVMPISLIASSAAAWRALRSWSSMLRNRATSCLACERARFGLDSISSKMPSVV